MEVELSGAEQTASTEANAASAANNDDREVIMSVEEGSDTSEVDEELIDYNEQDEIDAAAKAAERKALKEMLAKNGFAMKNILRTEQVKSHFTFPFSKENEMSLEDILSEIPKEDLHEVGMVQKRIYMPASFVQKWVIPAYNQSA